jgi:HAD superfamily phosphatase (TIGR01668 family)
MIFKLKADYIIRGVTDIDLEGLKQKGIKGLIFDLDNTLMAPRSGVLTREIADWLKAVQQDFKIAVVSNNRKATYIEKAAKIVGCPVEGRANKPGRKVMLKAIQQLDLEPENVAIIGDRPLTDIWVGTRLGSVTILVDPLIKDQENKFIRFLRKLERSFIQKIIED